MGFWRIRHFRNKMNCARNVMQTVLLVVLFLSGTLAAAETSLEYDVKAAYIFNFMQFIDWREPEDVAAKSPLTICVIGDNPIGAALAELTKRKIKGRSIEVRDFSGMRNVPNSCHIVVIGRSAEEMVPSILIQLAGSNVLTVSDIPEFARGGGGIGFVIDQGKVKIEINARAIEQAGLTVSAKLMEVARIVE